MSDAPPRILSTLYRGLVGLQPERHRHRYRDEQALLFEEIWAVERPRHAVARVAWTLSLFGRVLWASIRLRAAELWAGVRRGHVGGPGGRGMRADVKFTWRALGHARWYAATVVGVIAITVALATTVFAVVDGVLFKPLPYPAADRLVRIEPGFKGIGPRFSADGWRYRETSSELDVANWQAAVPGVQITGFSPATWSEMGSGVNDDTAGMAQVQPNFFDVIGVRPAIGGFADDDFVQNVRIRPVILTHETWQARFGGSTDAVGRTVLINDTDGYGFRVVGVMPEGFTFPTAAADVSFLAPYVSSAESRTDPKRRSLYEVIARLPPGMPGSLLAERLAPALATTAAAFPPQGPRPAGRSEKSWRAEGPYDDVVVSPLATTLARESHGMFLAAFVAVFVLVLIAAANVSSLMTARVWERAREFQMRRALGASAVRLARLWTVEAAILVGMGGLLGVLAAAPLLQLILPLLPDEVVLLKPARLDQRVAGFVILTVVALAALVSLAPMLRSMRLPATGTFAGGASRRLRTSGRFAVVGGQVAAAFVLTVLGACLVGSLMTVYRNRFPFETSDVVVLEGQVHGAGGRMGQSDERAVRGRAIQERLRKIPGVSGATLVAAQLLRGGGWVATFEPPPGVRRATNVDMWAVTEGFYDVLGLRPIEGRLPTADELKTGAPLIVLSERVARAYWPGKSAIGQTLVEGAFSHAPYTVVGVVPDVRWFAWDMESAIVYGPYTPLSRSPFLTFFLRTNGRTASIIAEGLKAMREVDPQVRPYTAVALDTMVRDSVSLRRFQSWLFGSFAGAALAVMGVGILGLLAMATARRTREIGIRCALGATTGGVGRLIVREQFTAVIAGLAAGGLVAAWAVSFVKGYLYQISVSDPRIWFAALVAVLIAAALGTIVPAWQASRVDPLKALRTE